MRYSVSNKVVLITGSNLGIGKATAIELANKGAKVVINGRKADRLETVRTEIEEKGGNVLAIASDVTRPDECHTMVQKIIDHYGRLDVLISNAGISMRGNFEDVSPEVFKQVMDVNFHGAVNITKAALPYLKESLGRIMYISSVAGIRGLQGISAYCSAKMALTALAESMRIELSKTGIKIGITYVGFTQNDPIKRTMAADGSLIPIEQRSNKNAQTTDEVARAIIRNVEKGRFKNVLTPLGKLNAFANKLFPGLVEKALIMANDKVGKMSK